MKKTNYRLSHPSFFDPCKDWDSVWKKIVRGTIEKYGDSKEHGFYYDESKSIRKYVEGLLYEKGGASITLGPVNPFGTEAFVCSDHRLSPELEQIAEVYVHWNYWSFAYDLTFEYNKDGADDLVDNIEAEMQKTTPGFTLDPDARKAMTEACRASLQAAEVRGLEMMARYPIQQKMEKETTGETEGTEKATRKYYVERKRRRGV